METEATAMPLLCLPNELLLLIASDLGIRDLTSLVITSRHLSNLITPCLNEFAIKDSKALDWAVLNNREDMVKRLLKLGASVDATDNDNETALHKAVTRGNVSIVQLLLENNASLEIETISYKETPLLRAAAGFSETVIRLLVEKGADVNAENLDLRSVLSVARAWRGYLRRAEGWEDRVEELLLKHGADRSRARYYL